MAAPASFVDPNPDAVPSDLVPIEVQLVKGQEYYWCKCGLTKTPPFCDGSHRAEGKIKPVKFVAQQDGSHWMCQCKGTSDPTGLCDGAHQNKEYFLKKYNQKLLKANSALKEQNDALNKQIVNVRTTALVVFSVVATGLFAFLKLSSKK